MAAKDARKSADPTVHLSGGLALRKLLVQGVLAPAGIDACR
jgi:hypothetical protein